MPDQAEGRMQAQGGGAPAAHWARYPFLPEVGPWLNAQGPDLGTLLEDAAWAHARALGRQRVVGALRDATQPAEAWPNVEVTLVAYGYARLLVSALPVGQAHAIRRLALAEALRVGRALEQEENPVRVVEAAAAVGLVLEPVRNGFQTHLAEYLRVATVFRDVPWKLTRQSLVHGFVQLSREKAARLVQEVVRRRIEAELPRPLPGDVRALLQPDLVEAEQLVRAWLSQHVERVQGPANLASAPPCMVAILASLQRGENASHAARMYVTTFLHAIGFTPEQIMQQFAQAPDFREDLTRYQVEHVTGVSGSTVYSPPSCTTMQTARLCTPDAVCAKRRKDNKPLVTHVMDYYEYKEWLKARDARKQARVPSQA